MGVPNERGTDGKMTNADDQRHKVSDGNKGDAAKPHDAAVQRALVEV